MRFKQCAMIVPAALAAGVVFCAPAGAQTLPVQNPGFNVFEVDEFTGEVSTTQLIVNDRFIDGFAGGMSETEPLYRISDGQPSLVPGANGPQSNELGSVSPPAWNTIIDLSYFQGIGILRDDVEFDNPTGTAAFVVSNNSPGHQGGFTQTLQGIQAQPNTTYTLRVNVMDRDVSHLTGGLGDILGIAPNISVDLLAGTTFLPGTSDFTPPAESGGTSVFTRTVTTGATVPTGDLMIRLYAAGTSNQYNAHTIFDNVSLTAVPEPAALSLLGVAALAAGRRRRRA